MPSSLKQTKPITSHEVMMPFCNHNSQYCGCSGAMFEWFYRLCHKRCVYVVTISTTGCCKSFYWNKTVIWLVLYFLWTLSVLSLKSGSIHWFPDLNDVKDNLLSIFLLPLGIIFRQLGNKKNELWSWWYTICPFILMNLIK